MFRVIYSLLLIVFVFSRAALADTDIPVISMGTDGREIVRGVPKNTYTQVIAEAVGAVHDSLLPELACTAPDQGRWKLDTLIVGVAIGATLGLGPIFSVQTKPRIRLLYTRGSEPTFPLQ